MSFSSQKNGIGITSIAAKMSFAIPLIIGIVFGESLEVKQIINVCLAGIAIFTILMETWSKQLKNIWILVIIFIGSGVIMRRWKA